MNTHPMNIKLIDVIQQEQYVIVCTGDLELPQQPMIVMQPETTLE
jgi:hypothetical protein